MTLIPFELSRGVGSMQSTGQKLTHASQPVQLSGITTAISLGFFFFRVIFAGASGMIAVGFVFFGSGPYATFYCAPMMVARFIVPRKASMRSMVSPIWLLGVDAPAVIPIVRTPWGNQPWLTTSSLVPAGLCRIVSASTIDAAS